VVLLNRLITVCTFRLCFRRCLAVLLSTPSPGPDQHFRCHSQTMWQAQETGEPKKGFHNARLEVLRTVVFRRPVQEACMLGPRDGRQCGQPNEKRHLPEDLNPQNFMIWYDIFNCNLVATRWQQYSTHIHTNSTGNDIKQTIYITTQKLGRARGRALSLRVLPWHLPYNWGKARKKNLSQGSHT
jgi:hypothetical protein